MVIKKATITFAQFLFVQHGGQLVQDCNRHAIADTHEIINSTGDVFEITSTHHQMANWDTIDKDKAVLVAKSKKKLSDYYRDSRGVITVSEEPEIIYYPETNSLGIQGHPEMMSPEYPVIDYLNLLIKKLLVGNEVY